MSKRSKQATKDRNRKAKQAKKLAQTAKYEAWRDAGQNKKSARAKANAKRGKSTSRMGSHMEGDCGNSGCKRCFPNSVGNNPWLSHPGSCIYGKRWSSSIYKKAA